MSVRQGEDVQSFIDKLRPRQPAREPGPVSAAFCWRLATQALDLESFVALVARHACEHCACSGAELRLGTPVSQSAIVDGSHLVLLLGNGRGSLRLQFAGSAELQRLAAADLDWAWIDYVDLRFGELLNQQSLQLELEATRDNEHLQRALYEIADLAFSDIDLAQMLQRVHQVVARLTYAENLYVALYDEGRDVMYFPYHADTDDPSAADAGQELAAADYPSSLTFAVLHSGQSLMGSSAGLREQLGLSEDERLGPDCVDWLGVPMLEGERVRGAVVIQSYDDDRRYSAHDRDLLSFVAQHILSVVTRKQHQDQLEAEVQRRTAELGEANRSLRAEVNERQRAQKLQATLYHIAELASERTGIDAFYVGVHEAMSELLNAKNFFIALLASDGAQLEFPYYVDEHDELMPRRLKSKGLTELVLDRKAPLLATESELRRLSDSGEIIVFGTRPKCWLGVPLMLDEQVLGAMVVQSYIDESDYGQIEQEVLQFASFHIATALERKQTQERLRLAHVELERRVEQRTEALRLVNQDLRDEIVVRERIESQLKHEAFHDALTGLPNRASLLARLSDLLRRFRKHPDALFAVLFLDLDRFKVVNDSVGHLLGDELLIEAGRRLAACVRDPDSVARLGGDEFTILLERIDSVDDACAVARRVLDAFHDPIRLEDKEIYTSASIGIALAHPRYSLPEELLRDADVAMYRAKTHGRQRFELFDEQLRLEALNMLDLESDMRRALKRREFEPFLQPIVRLNDGAIVGYEALLRWRHVSRGLLLPADFLSVAEESGNVEQIDWQIYEQVFRSIPELGESQAYVGINVSARHFRSANLTKTLLEMLRAYQVPPWRVRIEVTEGALLHNPEQACATMLSLRDAGVLTSLDDFGTGYSSLSYLHRFPLHSLKIDRSFIAEGVETVVQRDALRRLDCSLGQGFLFALPRPAEELSQA